MKTYNYKIGAATFTLSSKQIHDDKFIRKHLFEPLLRILRNKYKMKHYIWKAEAQENDNIHFHLLLDVFVNKDDLRILWNTLQDVHGYVERSGIIDPPSTRIDAVIPVGAKNMSDYLIGYVCKKDEYKKKITDSEGHKVRKRVIECKLWDASKELKSMKVCTIVSGHPMGKVISWMQQNDRGFQVNDYVAGYKFISQDEIRNNPVIMQVIKDCTVSKP